MPRNVSRIANGTASTLQFVNSTFCKVKYETKEKYKESGIFSQGKNSSFETTYVCACVCLTVRIVELEQLN